VTAHGTSIWYSAFVFAMHRNLQVQELFVGFKAIGTAVKRLLPILKKCCRTATLIYLNILQAKIQDFLPRAVYELCMCIVQHIARI